MKKNQKCQVIPSVICGIMTVCVNMICTFSFAQVIGSAFGLTRAILCDLAKKKKKNSLTLQQVSFPYNERKHFLNIYS